MLPRMLAAAALCTAAACAGDGAVDVGTGTGRTERFTMTGTVRMVTTPLEIGGAAAATTGSFVLEVRSIETDGTEGCNVQQGGTVAVTYGPQTTFSGAGVNALSGRDVAVTGSIRRLDGTPCVFTASSVQPATAGRASPAQTAAAGRASPAQTAAGGATAAPTPRETISGRSPSPEASPVLPSPSVTAGAGAGIGGES